MCITFLKRLVIPFSVAICLIPILAITPSVAQQASPDRAEFPGRRIGGGTRGECLSGRQPLVALNSATNLGVTAKDTPSVYFLMPTLEDPRQVEFILRDSQENSVYETSFDIDTTQEIVGIHLPEGSLEVNQPYHWYFSIVCDPHDRSQNIVLTGWLQRVPSDISESAMLESNLEASLERVRLYQEAGLWIDAIATVVELRQTYPNDNNVRLQWTELLQTLELDSVIQPPIASQL